MIYRIVVFLILNFGALAIGGLFTSSGVQSEWYNNLDKAPWTPPGWVFGWAWTTIMICFSVYMSHAWNKANNIKILGLLFTIQWVLNVLWNPAFFYYHNTLAGLIIISCLTLLIGFFLIKYWLDLRIYSLLIIPYLVWLLIATSLNGYILINN